MLVRHAAHMHKFVNLFGVSYFERCTIQAVHNELKVLHFSHFQWFDCCKHHQRQESTKSPNQFAKPLHEIFRCHTLDVLVLKDETGPNVPAYVTR